MTRAIDTIKLTQDIDGQGNLTNAGLATTYGSNSYNTATFTSNNYLQAQGFGTGDVSNTYLQAQGYLTTETGDVSNTYLQAQGYGTGDVSNTYLQTQLGGGDSRRNIVINGAMQVAQRGVSNTGITGSGLYTVDRFRFSISSLGTWTQTQEADGPDGIANSLKMECTTADASPAAGDFFIMTYRIEGQDLQDLKKGTPSAESTTLSFWVKSNKTGTYVAELLDGDNSNRHIGKSFTVNASGTWEYKTITFEGDTTGALDDDNEKSLTLIIWLGSGSNYNSGTLQTSWGVSSNADRAVGNVNLADTIGNYFQITGVQFELGETATAFEHRSYSEELASCQRYYFQPTSIVYSDGSVGYKYSTARTFCFNSTSVFPVKMRADPTVTELTAPTYNNCSSLSFSVSDTGYTSRVTVSADGNYRAYSWLAEFDAEL